MKANLRAVIALSDERLHPFLRCESEYDRSRQLERLIEAVARPVIERSLSRFMRGATGLQNEDAEDIAAAVVVRILRKLEAMRVSEDEAIYEFDEYVARLVFNAAADFRRMSAPERSRLKRRLRYALTTDSRLTTWETASGLAVALAGWRESNDVLAVARFDPASAGAEIFDRDDVGGAAAGILKALRAPVLLDRLVSILADLWNVPFEDAAPLPGALIDASQSPVMQYESRETIRIVWEEIVALPERQRAALLLNLRDAFGLNAAVLFPLTGAASFAGLAAAMGLSTERLSELWNRLPLPDAEIAELLGISRQQVINLRKSARERLHRRVARRQRGATS